MSLRNTAGLAARNGFGGELGEENQGQKQDNQPQGEVNIKPVAKFGQIDHICSNTSSILTAKCADSIARTKEYVNTAGSVYVRGRNKKAVVELASIDDRILNWLGRMIMENDINLSLEEAVGAVKRQVKGVR